MTDPFLPLTARRVDPGPTPLDLLRLIDGRGESSALGAWTGDWNTYAGWLYHICLRRRLAPSEAADLVQDVFVALPAFVRLRGSSPTAPLRPWLVRVLWNKISDFHRNRQGVAGFGVISEPDDVVAVLPDEFAREAPESDCGFAHTMQSVLERARARCNETNWRAFWGVVVEGRPTAELATELNVEPHRIHTARSRVLKQIRQEIGLVAGRHRDEFDATCWEMFTQVTRDGDSVVQVARSLGVDESDVTRAVARVLRRLRGAEDESTS
jgi:RNA polymerase sigma-70 factor, ECF subfamily